MDTTNEYAGKDTTYYSSEVTWTLFKFSTETDWKGVEEKYKQDIGKDIELFTKNVGAEFKPSYWLKFQR